MAFGQSRAEEKAKAKKKVQQSGKVKQVKKQSESMVKRNYYSTGNRVYDAMSNQTHFNKNPNPKYANKDAQLDDNRLYLRAGQRRNAIADYDETARRWNYVGQKKDAYKTIFVRDGRGNYTTKSGYKMNGTRLLSDNMMKEYMRNDKVSTNQKMNFTPIHKVNPTGKFSSPIKEGFKNASKAKNPISAIGHVAGGFAGAGMKGIMEVADVLNTLNYSAHGFTSGMVEGFNNDGKLNKGELGKAFNHGLDKASRGFKSGFDTSGEYDDARYGWYDTMKAFSDDKIERNIRKGKKYTDKELKDIDARLAGLGLGLDVGGALLTANAGGIARAGTKLTAKGSKISGSALKGLSKVAKVADLGVDLPIADLMRGTNKTFKGAKKAITSDEVSKVVNKQLSKSGKVAKSQAVQEHLVNSTVNKVNKLRGVRNVNHGVKLAGFEVVSPKTVQKIADSKLNVPGRALNTVIDQIKATRRASGLQPNIARNLSGDLIDKAIQKGKVITPGKKANQNAIPSFANLQAMSRANGNQIVAGKPLSHWANIEADVANEVFEKGNVVGQKFGGKDLNYWKEMQRQIADDIGAKKQASKSIGKSSNLDVQMRNAMALDDERDLRRLKQLKDKPALQEVINKIRPVKSGNDFLRPTEQGSDAFYDYLMKKNPRMYAKLTGESDVIENTINATAKLSNPTKTPNLKEFTSKIKKANVEKPVKTKIGKQIPYNERFTNYDNALNSMFKQKADKGAILERQAHIERITKPLTNGKLSKKERANVVNDLNDLFFDGKEVISYNASKNDLKRFSEVLQEGLDNVHNETPDILNGALNKFKLYSESLVDPNYNAKTNIRASKFKTTKGELNKKKKALNAKVKSGMATVADREELRKVQQTINEFDKWWKDYGKLDPEQFEKTFNPNQKQLKGYYDALEEHADMAKHNKLGYDDFVTSPKGSKEYKKQMEEFSEYMLENGDDKLLDAKRNLEARQAKDGSMSYSPLAEKELAMSNVGEVGFDLKTQVNAMRKRYNFEKPNLPKNLKVNPGQKLKDLPPVQHNLKNLRKVIEKEVQVMYKEPNAYKSMNEAFKQIKMDYVTSLRKLGVDDSKYFDKVTALQNELKQAFENGGNDPKVKMDITLLSRKIEDTFKNIEKSFDLHDGAKNEIYDKIYNRTKATQTDDVNAFLRGDNLPNNKVIDDIPKTPKNGSESVKQVSEKKKNPILNLYDEITKDYKAGVTGLNPGWHMMNYAQNKLNNAYGIGGMVFDRKMSNQAKDLVTHLQGEKELLGRKYGRKTPTEGMLNEVIGKNADGSALRLKDVADIAELEGLVDTKFLDDVKNKGGNFFNDYVRPSGDKSVFGGLGLTNNIRTESNDKMMQMLGQIKKGNSLTEGVEKANKYLFDYDDITKGEKEIMKRIMPFYTYYRKNVPLQLERFANSPRAMSQYIDAKNQFEKGIADEDKQRRNEWNNDKLQVPGFYKEDERGNPYNLMFNPSTPWDALMQLPTPDGKGINNLPSFNPILQSLYDYYGKGEDYFGNKFDEEGINKNALQYLAEQVVEPSLGTVGKLGKHEREKDKLSDENAKLELLKILSGVNAKYYKSHQEWNIENDKEYKEEFKKKVLRNRYK